MGVFDTIINAFKDIFISMSVLSFLMIVFLMFLIFFLIYSFFFKKKEK